MSASSSDTRTSIVTGGGSGIGAATARLLRARGERVVICGRRPEPLERVAAETGALGVVADVSTPAGVEHLLEQTLVAYARIDGLVLNAGVIHPGTLEELSLDEWDETMRINVTGPFLLMRAALPHLREVNGAVVGVASVGALRSGTRGASYAASKAALISLVKGVAVDHATDGIRANCVCPGWVRTEMSDFEMAEIAASRDIDVEHAYRLAASLVPEGRVAKPEEVAHAIAWLLSPAASYITGACLPVDGGSLLVDAGTVPFA